VATRRVEAVRDQPLHPELAHVAERHRLAKRVLLFDRPRPTPLAMLTALDR
jgi:hypothetical protein